jgi:hypothetical protein
MLEGLNREVVEPLLVRKEMTESRSALEEVVEFGSEERVCLVVMKYFLIATVKQVEVISLLVLFLFCGLPNRFV